MPIGAQYTVDQIAIAARQAGFPEKDVITAVAIALAESGGKSVSSAPNRNGTTDYGVWQINSTHSNLLAKGDWRDLNANAAMAYALYADAGNRFTPWTGTYTNGIYVTFLPAAKMAKQPAPRSPGIDWNPFPDIPSPSDLFGAFPGADAISKIASYLSDPGFWKRVGIAYLGAMLAIIGIVFLLLQTDKGKQLADVGVAAATKGVVK